ncbi:MAG TPA: class I SAM-dependent methyltransferase [Isosphaeraceae bacterium]|jgi:ubiquinone/menaquinone biosynthesis C-methylase UbiE|nr:class I SAM-dependent methyltransferase [Isosphaeraceae bacterium]
MAKPSAPGPNLPPEVESHYAGKAEHGRLESGVGRLEFERTKEILQRHLPPPPAVIADVGGGPGLYACWLARQGYEVHLVDPLQLHVAQAEEASSTQPTQPVSTCKVGDARALSHADESADAVLLLGPLYHLTDRSDRLAALGEARRVLRRDGTLIAAAIARFASALDGLCRGHLDDAVFASIVERDLTDGQHRNPTGHPEYFTTAFFHHPDELRREIADAGLILEHVIAVEGPAWLLQNLDLHWDDPARRDRLLGVIRRIEAEPTVLGASAHMLAVARK